MTRDIEPALAFFTEEMRRKLRKNEHKDHWMNYSPGWLMKRLHEEVRELDIALSQGYPKDIIEEAADVANFCMMIADQARQVRRD